jgi:phosphatidylserine decarboxylase
MGWSFAALALTMLAGVVGAALGAVVFALAGVLVALWLAFALFTWYFFRDPEARVPDAPGVVVAPAHGTVDWIEDTTELEFMDGPCRRVSIFLSVFDVHVQNAPVAGAISMLRHQAGDFVNAMRVQDAAHNENVLIGIESAEAAGERIAVRLVAGLIARRIVPWVALGDRVERGGRVSLIQFGSRCDLYLPMTMELRVRLGDRVRGGETIVAQRAVEHAAASAGRHEAEVGL